MAPSLDSSRHNSRERNTMNELELHLDGLTVKVPKSAGQILNKAISERDAKLAKLTEEHSALQASFAGQAEKLAKAEADVKELPARLRGDVQARIALKSQARAVLGAEVKLDGNTDRELRADVLAKLAPKCDLTGKDDAYVSARFDAAIESVPPSGTPKQPAAA
jgi:hypothetical protein